MAGSVPGMPAQMGQTRELGGTAAAPCASVSAGQPQNILLAVKIWAWTSSPIVVRYSAMRLLASPPYPGMAATSIRGTMIIITQGAGLGNEFALYVTGSTFTWHGIRYYKEACGGSNQAATASADWDIFVGG